LSALGIARADDGGGAVRTFVTLPDGCGFRKHRANPANRSIYVATFDFGPNANKLLRHNRNGQARFSVQGLFKS